MKTELVLEQSLQLPTGTEPLPHQVAGHFYGVEGSRSGLLRDKSTGYVLKAISDERGWKELKFYQEVWTTNNENLRKLRSFIPFYYGVFETSGSKFIALKDLCEGFENPCMMDIKVGAITYEPGASEAKIKNETAKYPWATSVHFRILGIRVFDKGTKSYVVKDKSYGKSLTPATILDGFTFYLNISQERNSSLKKPLITQFLSKLHAIEDWFINCNVNLLRFISSSLFFVYSPTKTGYKSDVKMIDFPHVLTADGGNKGEPIALDDNYLSGLRNIIKQFETINELL